MASRRSIEHRFLRTSFVLLSSVAVGTLGVIGVGPTRVAGAGAAGPQMLFAGEVTSGESHSEIVVLFDERLDERVTPTAGDFTITVDNGTPVKAVAASYLFSGLVMDGFPSGVTFLRLDLPTGTTVGPSTTSISVRYKATSARLRDLALTEAADATFADGGVADVTGSFGLLAAVIDGQYSATHLVVLVLGQIDLASIPLPGDFAVTLNGTGVTVSGVVAPPVFNDLGIGVLDLNLGATSAQAGDVAHVHYWPRTNKILSRSQPTVTVPETDLDVPVLVEQNTAAATLTAGQTLTTATGSEPTVADPVATTVTTPIAGDVSISEGPVDPGLAGYGFFGQQVTIHAPAATDPSAPLILQFAIDASLVPVGQTAASLLVYRNGVVVPTCGTPGIANPSPCVAQRQTLTSGAIVITVDTLEASVWNMAAGNSPPPPPPSLTVPPDITTIATGPSGAAVSYNAHATDAFGAAIPPGCSATSGSTFPVGTTTVSCMATDSLGQRSSTQTFRVTVGYGFAGFFQPLNDPISSTNLLSVFKVGSTIPVKFALTYADRTTRISDAAASAIASACGATISLAQTLGTAPAVDEVVTSTSPNSGNCFRYDSTAHQFIFNLGTKGLPAPAQYALSASIVGSDRTMLATHPLAIGLR